ncbi:flagellar basal-body MS-ring/collar protein FliF [Rickettsia endosymbiont of Cardiosporidium cionae]|uniref:flagellar basal-body MS-ring/collar protein FliF n=1 Tax=Rickettsia endosymbiont of Cardiosporidium cionae TaxID=2777155 RepID=UPI00189450AF|nr:flagellar basal-body MS-ring/collar protein FliF [Rickettsia endosymbiont of Cardiosporidium cionae]KAF8818691.1 Flagellar M-ring protein [Rickettsia endosymbiont of Cardiosporidium cionae]
MSLSLSSSYEHVKYLLSNLSIRVIILISVVFFLILITIIYYSNSTISYSLLYYDLDPQDSNRIVHELSAKDIKYRLSRDNSVIHVETSNVEAIRVDLAQLGLPSSSAAVGYEIFDKEDSISVTSFTQNIKLLRALEGELSRTINAFDNVQKSRVHLVIPKRELFSKEKLEPKVSVMLKLKHNYTLNHSETKAITHLILTAVPGLESTNITIVDNKGRILKAGGSEAFNGNNEQNNQFRIYHETRLKNNIEELLGNILGYDKVKANVSVEMNFDKIVTNSEIYDPDGFVIRSNQTTDEREQNPSQGSKASDISVSNNLPGSDSSQSSNKNSSLSITEKSDQQTNYEISKTIKNHIIEPGSIVKISVGVLIDGTYQSNSQTKELKYTPRTEEEVRKIENLVKATVGFSNEREDKIEVINMQFLNSDLMQEDDNKYWVDKYQIPKLLQNIIILIIIMLMFIFIIKPLIIRPLEKEKKLRNIGLFGSNSSTGSNISGDVEKKTNVDTELQDSGVSSQSPEKINSNTTEGKQLVGIRQKINDIVSNNPEELVNIIRRWIHKD